MTEESNPSQIETERVNDNSPAAERSVAETACSDQGTPEMRNKEKKGPHRLTSFTGSCKSLVAKFLSTGSYEELQISSENIEQYLLTAQELKHIGLKNYCESELVKQLSPETSLYMMQLSEGYELQNLKGKCVRIIEDNFSVLWNTEDFKYLGKNEVLYLIKDTKVKTHPCVCKAVEFWRDYETEFRADVCNEMLKLFNHEAKNSEPTVNVENKKEQNEAAAENFHRYIAMFTFDESEKHFKVVVIDDKLTRRLTSQVQKLGHSGLDILVCCQQKDVTHAPYVYVAYHKGNNTTGLLKYDVILSKWKEAQNLKEWREGNRLICVENSLYLIGGVSSISKDDSFSPVDECKAGKQWKKVGYLDQCVKSPVCAVYGNNIYLFGGTLANGKYSSVIQHFDVTSSKSKILGQLPAPVSDGKAVVLNDKIYILSDDGSMFIFYPKTNTCTDGASHPHISSVPILSDFAMFTDDVDIFTAGGVCGENECMCAIYKYSVELNQWKKLNKCLPFPMLILGHCDIFMQPDIAMVPLID